MTKQHKKIRETCKICGHVHTPNEDRFHGYGSFCATHATTKIGRQYCGSGKRKTRTKIDYVGRFPLRKRVTSKSSLSKKQFKEVLREEKEKRHDRIRKEIFHLELEREHIKRRGEGRGFNYEAEEDKRKRINKQIKKKYTELRR